MPMVSGVGVEGQTPAVAPRRLALDPNKRVTDENPQVERMPLAKRQKDVEIALNECVKDGSLTCVTSSRLDHGLTIRISTDGTYVRVQSRPIGSKLRREAPV